MAFPTSTHQHESAIVNAPIGSVWEEIVRSDFSWWSLVDSSTLLHGNSPRELDATLELIFKDGHKWIIAIRELSSINHKISFEIISSQPEQIYSSALHTISLKRVDTNLIEVITSPRTKTLHRAIDKIGAEPIIGQTFVTWSTDYSGDVSLSVVVDANFKKRDSFGDLGRAVSITRLQRAGAGGCRTGGR